MGTRVRQDFGATLIRRTYIQTRLYEWCFFIFLRGRKGKCM